MRVACPNFREIIIAIESNFDAPDLGLPEVLRNVLVSEVQVSGGGPIVYMNSNRIVKTTALQDNLQHYCVGEI